MIVEPLTQIGDIPPLGDYIEIEWDTGHVMSHADVQQITRQLCRKHLDDYELLVIAPSKYHKDEWAFYLAIESQKDGRCLMLTFTLPCDTTIGNFHTAIGALIKRVLERPRAPTVPSPLILPASQ